MVKLTSDNRAKKYADHLAQSMDEYERLNAQPRPYDQYGIGQSVRGRMEARGRKGTAQFGNGDAAMRSSALSLG